MISSSIVSFTVCCEYVFGRVTSFKIFVSKFRSPHFFSCSLIRWFQIGYRFIKFGGKWRSRPFESQFWPISTVFVILSLAHSPRWASHLIIATYWLFASFSCINHFFCQLVWPQWPFVLRDYHRRCTVDRSAAMSTQNYLLLVTVVTMIIVLPWDVHK